MCARFRQPPLTAARLNACARQTTLLPEKERLTAKRRRVFLEESRAMIPACSKGVRRLGLILPAIPGLAPKPCGFGSRKNFALPPLRGRQGGKLWVEKVGSAPALTTLTLLEVEQRTPIKRLCDRSFLTSMLIRDTELEARTAGSRVSVEALNSANEIS